MKYLKVFETEALQNEFRSSQDYIEPHVSCLIDGENVKYNKSLEQLKVPFTIEATQDGTAVYFRQSSYAANAGLDPLKVEISTDGGVTWTEKTAHVQYEDDILAELDEGEKVLIRGKNEAYGFFDEIEEADPIDNCNFWADSPCYVYGNIMSLINGNDFARLRKVNQFAFAWFFSDYDGALDWSWVLSKEGEELLLPAITLANYCYYNMFYNCTGLTSAPELPATTLASYCYRAMFNGCTGLTVAPELPATTLANFCYSFMFQGCTGLTFTPELHAIALANGCYYYMFQGCTGLTSAPELPATTLANHCYSFMFYRCTGLTTAPELPATILANHCYWNMFNSCTSLTTAPELPATTLADSCYVGMFGGCTGLTVAPELPATTLANGCYEQMFDNCTGLTSAPELPATTLVDYCYSSIFAGCTNLSYIKAMFTTTPGSSYTSNWVNGVKATGTFVKNSAATWNVTGVNGIPTGWTVETASASNQEFVAIAVSSGNDYVIYIKSTELSDFVSMNTGVHVYSNEACTTQADDGYFTFTDSGLTAYYASEGNESGELPGCDEFEVSNGIINRYIIPE